MSYRKLGRSSDVRNAMLRDLTTDLFIHERIVTTETRAKEVRKTAEKMITLAKKGDLHSRRLVSSYIRKEVANISEEDDAVVIQSASKSCLVTLHHVIKSVRVVIPVF